MTATPEKLTDILDLERLEVDLFRGRSPHEHQQRVFGGQVAAQSLVAAGRTVPVDERFRVVSGVCRVRCRWRRRRVCAG